MTNDDWKLALMVIQLCVTALLVIGQMVLAGRTRGIAKIEDLQAELRSTAEEITATKFNALADGLRQEIRHLSDKLTNVNDRLDDGDRQFELDGTKLHKLELQLVERVNAICTQMLTHAASKEDFRALHARMDAINASLGRVLARQDHLGGANL